MKYGLIGRNIYYSLSKKIHLDCGLNYDILSVNKTRAKRLLFDNTYAGFNLTIPYKKRFIFCLDQVKGVAKELGVINTIKRENGKLIGYNTDYDGLIFAIKNANADLKGKSVVILGTGASSITATFVAFSLGAKSVDYISRRGKVNYKNYFSLCDRDVLINTSPVGTFPKEDELKVDLKRFYNLSLVIDLVYNPINTGLILEAKKLNIKTISGIYMLCEQALLSQDIWLDKKHDIDESLKLVKEIKKSQINVVLSGMAGVGKTTIGIALKERLKKEFFDVDEMFCKKYKITPEKFIIKHGERVFRKREGKIVKDLSKKRGVIIALGGGSVLEEKNVMSLKHSGVIFLLERDINKISDLNRPLSKASGIEKLYNDRYKIYHSTCDFTVKNDDIDSALGEIILDYENYCN